MSATRSDYPVFVTFESGAHLLVELDIDPTATATALRYIARTSSDWPFGPGRQHDYVLVGNARTMETGVFLDFFKRHPRGGRGPDRQPRKRKGAGE